VYISKISLKNIRGFKSLEFDLDRGGGKFAGWTVFTGSNGSGKSTLLKAIAFCLFDTDTKVVLQRDFGFFRRKGSNGELCRIDLNFFRCSADDSTPPGPSHTNYPDWKTDYYEGISIDPGPFRPGLTSGEPGGVFTNHRYYANPVLQPPNSEILITPLKGWFACGYGPFRRITSPKENVEQIQQREDSKRFATLFLEGASLSEVAPWLIKLKLQEYEGSEEAANQLAFFLDFVRDSFLPDGFSVDRVDSEGLWLKDSNGVELPWFDMSDGQRVAIILVADILRHLIGAFGLEGLYGRDEAGKIFVKRSGVVLIDEIDAHLHPSWQREIGFWLKGHFPNVQFLVTSHSPIILQAADPNGLFVLPEPGSEDQPHALAPDEYQKIIASRPDSILLSPAFGLENTRSDMVVEKRARYSKLQSKKRAGGKLSVSEEKDLQGLLPFVETGEED
jgi:energy-coupling factor transporter ATP-binding protein EcfA2